jgi:hypothetical protein
MEFQNLHIVAFETSCPVTQLAILSKPMHLKNVTDSYITMTVERKIRNTLRVHIGDNYALVSAGSTSAMTVSDLASYIHGIPHEDNNA